MIIKIKKYKQEIDMKRRNFLILLILLSFSTGILNATVRRVNNLAGTGAGYTTLQSAHDAANPGDTLMVEPGKPYRQLVLTKRLVILGPGYFLGQNDDSQAGLFSAQVDSLTFNAGSGQTLVSGLHIKDKIFINTSLITLESNLIMFSTSYSYLINIAAELSGIVIKKNFIENTESIYAGVLNIGGGTSIILSNNYISSGHTNSSYSLIKTLASTQPTLANNNIRGYLELYTGATVKNNIWMSDGIGGTFSTSSSSYNITENGTLTGVTDITAADIDAVFVGSGSTDGKWQLSEGSEGEGAGEGGTDCGMFGGTDPYILSGINQSLPRIYYLSSSGQGTATSGLQVHIKAKAAE